MIERPWEEFACDRCIHCFEENMCSAYKLITSYAYCPQIRNCNKFKEMNGEIKAMTLTAPPYKEKNPALNVTTSAIPTGVHWGVGRCKE
jgi:hypothetical protein